MVVVQCMNDMEQGQWKHKVHCARAVGAHSTTCRHGELAVGGHGGGGALVWCMNTDMVLVVHWCGECVVEAHSAV